MQAGPVRTRKAGRVGIVAMAHPPANALDAALRAALADAVDDMAGNDEVAAIVLAADGAPFSTGLDIRAMDRPGEVEALARLCARIENCPKPVVAALTGAALGGGAELAMAAHWRLAPEGAVIGLPDIALGLVPGAGGTQRLARIAGPRAALRMLLSGRPLGAAEAREVGLIDGIVAGDAVSGAVALAETLAAEGKAPRRSGSRRDRIADGRAALDAVAAARMTARTDAAIRMVDCVEAAVLLPAGTALAFEAEAHATLRDGDDSRALRHLFVAERRIDAGLLRVENGTRLPTDAGRAIVDRLFAAQDAAIVALVAAGVPETRIDGAMVAYGYDTGPFGGTQAVPGADDAARRITGALLAEGARLLERGTVARSGDIDALAVHGMGFPRARGGPMMAAEIAGLPELRRDLSAWSREDAVWAVSGPLDRASRVAGGFSAAD